MRILIYLALASALCAQKPLPSPVNGGGSGGGGGAVTSVAGTAGQITVSPTTGDSIVSLPAAVRINASSTFGEFIVGSTATTNPRGITSGQWDTGANSARFNGLKSRGTQTSPTTVVTGDLVTRWSGFPYDGSNYLEAASIVFGTEGTIAATRTPTFISFFTGTDAAPTVLTQALKIDSAQVSTFAGRIIGAVNGALSAPAKSGTGTWITGGSATTTKPYWLIEPAGTTSTGWVTLGTGLGINAASGFTGNLIDLQVAGSRKFRVWDDGTFGNVAVNVIDLNTSGGCITLNAGATGQGLCAGTGLRLGSTRLVGFQPDNAFGSMDAAIGRNAAGILEVNSGTLGTLRDLKVRNLIATTVTSPVSPFTFATLPAAADGTIMYCSDCTVTSGASNVCAGSGTGALVVDLAGAHRCFNAQN